MVCCQKPKEVWIHTAQDLFFLPYRNKRVWFDYIKGNKHIGTRKYLSCKPLCCKQRESKAEGSLNPYCTRFVFLALSPLNIALSCGKVMCDSSTNINEWIAHKLFERAQCPCELYAFGNWCFLAALPIVCTSDVSERKKPSLSASNIATNCTSGISKPSLSEEFNSKISQIICVSATPADYELNLSDNTAEQLIRPTGLLDPKVEIPHFSHHFQIIAYSFFYSLSLNKLAVFLKIFDLCHHIFCNLVKWILLKLCVQITMTKDLELSFSETKLTK